MTDDLVTDGKFTIPAKYRKSGQRPIKTVGELLAHLQNLPPDMPLDTGFAKSLDVVVTHHVCHAVGYYQCTICEFEGDLEGLGQELNS